jgi:hypothetical protein
MADNIKSKLKKAKPTPKEEKKQASPEAIKTVKKIVDKAKASPKKANQSYEGEPINITGNVKMSKGEPAKTKKATTPKKKKAAKRTEKSSETKKDSTLMSNIIVNDTEGVSDNREETKIARGAEVMRQATHHAPNWLVGLAPLTMGAIMGDIGEGASVAGDALIEQYQHNRADEDKELDFQRKLAMVDYKSRNGEGDGTPRKVMENGKVIFRHNRKDIEGKEAGYSTSDLGKFQNRLDIKTVSDVKKERLLGKHIKFDKDNFGRNIMIDKQHPNRRIYMQDKDLPSEPQQKWIDSIKTSLRKEVDYGQMNTYRQLANSLGRLNSRNEKGESNELAGKDALKQYIKRTEGGRLTDFDVEFMQYMFGSEKYKQQLEEFMSGTMNDKLKANLMSELAHDLKFKKKEIQRKYRQAYSAGAHRGIKPANMRKFIGAPVGLFDNAIVEFKDKNGKLRKSKISMQDYTDMLDNGKADFVGVNFE